MPMGKNDIYESYSDRDLVDATLSGNEEAAIYLIYKRHYGMLRYVSNDCCQSFDYADDLCNELFIHLRGKNNDWQPLRSWQGISTFRTWLCRVARHLFLKKRATMIGFRDKKLYSENEDDPDPVEQVAAVQPTSEDAMMKVMLLEAINGLSNADQRLVILKELQGYSHEEIADILNQVRRQENRIKLDKAGNEILANAAAVDVLKQRAVAQIKQTMGVKKQK